MGTISSGVGLFSGLNITDIVNQLMSIEKRPATLIQNSIDKNTDIQSTLQTLSLSILGAKLASTRLGAGQAFASRTASSSSDTILATAGPKATVGSFSFTPKRQVTTQQVLSSGYASLDEVVGAGTITVARGGFVDRGAKLDVLNGGAGVGIGSIRVIDKAGNSANVDLSGALTISEVVDTINATDGIGVTASVDGDRLRLSDISGGTGSLTIREVGSGTTAADLGLTSLTADGGDYLSADVFNLSGDMDLSLLNDGNGIRSVTGVADFSITDDSGTYNVRVDGKKSVQEVIDAIATDSGGAVTASIDGNRLTLSGTGNITVAAANNSLAGYDLGLIGSGTGGSLTGKNILGGLDTVLLNSLGGGYQGGADTLLQAGQITISGTGSAPIDLSGASTLQEVVDGINEVTGTTGVTAKINDARNGISLTGSGAFTVTDDTGNLASFLNIDGSSSGDAIASGSLDHQYINENTRLDSLNGGAGVFKGKLRITDGFGTTKLIDLSQSDDTTVGKAIQDINGAFGTTLKARINDTGDGILLEQVGGAAAIQVTEDGNGTTAKDLNILGTGAGGVIDGAFRTTITVGATDTLDDVLDAIALSEAPIQITSLNDGSAFKPIRMSITSKQSGAAGELLFDAGSTSLRFSEVSAAHDAVLLAGSTASGSSSYRLTSKTNTFTDVVPGLTLDLKGASSSPVNVTVTENEQEVVDAVKGFVDSYNTVRSFIKDNASYDTETETRGILFTESSVRQATSSLSQFITGVFTGTGSTIRTAGEVGLSLSSAGELQFDETAFRNAYEADPSGVESFFTTRNRADALKAAKDAAIAAGTDPNKVDAKQFRGIGTGFVETFEAIVDDLTGENGSLTGRASALTQNIESQNKSIEEITARLDIRQQRLLMKFYNLELSLAGLQSQQNSLSQLSSLAASLKSSSS